MVSENSSVDSGMLRVLVADDDPIQRSLISARLLRLNGLTVEAEDGVAAWALLSSQTFDMAIVDLGMPNLDGFGLIQCMRDHPRTRYMPVIVMTSRHDRDAIEGAMQAGASSFLVKPIAWSTFEHHVGFLLRLVRTSKDSRATSQKTIAAHRARETVLGNLCGEALGSINWILDEVEQIRRLPMPGDSAPFLLQRLTQIADECRLSRTRATTGRDGIAALSERIVASDRKERLDTIVNGAIDVHAALAQSRKLRTEITLPPGDTWVACDGDAVQMALAHLLENAIRHSADGDKVCVGARIYPDGLLAIEITDRGEGVHPDVLARSIAPMAWSGEGRRSSERIGLGLVLSKAIAEAHAGTLEVRSMPGQGTTALLVLPPERVTNIVDQG